MHPNANPRQPLPTSTRPPRAAHKDSQYPAYFIARSLSRPGWAAAPAKSVKSSPAVFSASSACVK